MFNLRQTWILPDMYKVTHPSLNDIMYVLKPTYTPMQVKELCEFSKATDLHGKEYIPGYVGLNNIKNNDFINVIVQAISQVGLLRDYFLLEEQKKSELADRFGMLLRKLWNSRAFKGHVSPHEFIQAPPLNCRKFQTQARNASSWVFSRMSLTSFHGS
jgi:U4/U6.U5 tri-snRNP-associated protein 2